MADTSVLVDLETNIEGQRLVEGVLDFGRLVEALVFYDRVYVCAPREIPFVSLCRRLKVDGDLATFNALLRDGEIVIVDYDFYTAIQTSGEGGLDGQGMHIVTPETKALESFERHSLGHPELQTLLSGSERVKLRRAALKHLFGIRLGPEASLLTREANGDYGNAEFVTTTLRRSASALGVAVPDGPLVRSVQVDPRGFVRVDWAIDFDALDASARLVLRTNDPVLRRTGPLAAALGRDRLVWTAKVVGADLHLTQPMEGLVTDKLQLVGRVTKSVKDVVTTIATEADFPDLRAEANAGLLRLGEAVKFRSKATRFRKWLHEERTHDRDAIQSYVGAFMADSRFAGMRKRIVSLSAAAIGGAVGAAVEGPVGAAVGSVLAGAVSEGVQSLTSEIAASLTSTWRPILFGSWLKREIARPR